jgi:acyl-coenzyme A thioesterase PaaI-like protein
MLGRAAAAVSAHHDVIAASAHYLHAPRPGPVAIEAELLRSGRSATQVRARMSQDSVPCVEALLAASRLDATAVRHWQSGLPEMSSVPYEDCIRLAPRMPGGDTVAMLDAIEVRLEPGSSGFTTGSPTGAGEIRGWLALPGGEGFDPTSLLFAVDAFPPATSDVEFSGWVPTLQLTVYVRALPAPGPVRVLQRAQLIEARRVEVDETCHIWDRAGRLVAHGSQLAGIRLG